MNNAIDHFRTAIQDEGTTPPDTIIGDGNLHRYKIDGKLIGWYVLHLDGRTAGSFGDWKQGIKVIWKMAGNFKPLSDAARFDFAIERHRQAQVRQAEEKARHNKAIEKAAYIWNRSTPVINHQYLVKKGVKPYSVRCYRGSLVIPLYDESGVLVSLQFIGDDGSKRMMKNGKAQGACCFINDAADLKPGGTILIAEGWATGASLYEATGHFTIVAFSAGNLTVIAIQTRKHHPANEIIICGDNDASGVGQKAAREAALAINGRYILPPTLGDFNDHLAGSVKYGS
ncbi:MAG: toprim domain-containing protein [Methylococcales bacterium]|nr:toprim domain-containing protein [Methylococcales bacterium]